MNDYSELKSVSESLIADDRSSGLKTSALFDKFDAMATPDLVLGLIAEVERLNEEYDKAWRHDLNDKNNVKALAAEVISLSKDAARYRWLRDESIDPGAVIDKKVGIFNSEDGGYPIWEYRAGKELDDAIDTAMIEVNNK